MITLTTSSALDAFMQLKAHLLEELSEFTASDLPEAVLAKSFAPNIPPDVRAAAMGELVDAGLAELVTGLRDEKTGRMAGSGYRITRAGASYVAQLRWLDGPASDPLWRPISDLDLESGKNDGLRCMVQVTGHSIDDPAADIERTGYAVADSSALHGFRQADLQMIEADGRIYGPTLKIVRFVELGDVLPAVAL